MTGRICQLSKELMLKTLSHLSRFLQLYSIDKLTQAWYSRAARISLTINFFERRRTMPYINGMFPVCMLKNTKTGRFHPIVFRPGPAPSSRDEEDVQRYKSSGHHTEGFDTLEEARASVKERPEWHLFDIMWNWNPDEEDIPAIVEWFAASDMMPAAAG